MAGYAPFLSVFNNTGSSKPLRPPFDPAIVVSAVLQLIAASRKEGADDILVVVGGVIPPQDYDMLKKAGVAAVYGPGANIPAAASEILGLLQKKRKAA